jgi:hypothetical protein
LAPHTPVLRRQVDGLFGKQKVRRHLGSIKGDSCGSLRTLDS